jgi:hypothetical protein
MAVLHAFARSVLWGIALVLAVYDITAWLLMLVR